MIGGHVKVQAYPVPDGTVGVGTFSRFYPYAVPNGTMKNLRKSDNPVHRRFKRYLAEESEH